MPQLFQKALQLIIGTEPLAADSAYYPVPEKTAKPKKRPLKKLTERELIQLESEIGATIFGQLPKGCRREFFNLDQSTWIWYEESVDGTTHQRKATTIRYEVHENGILKVQEGARYNFLEGQELQNFLMAVQLYYEQVCRDIYHVHAPSVGVQA